MTVKFNWRGDKVIKNNRKAAKKALKDISETLLDDANKTVPHDEGILELSGTPSVDEKELTAAVSYDTPYAVKLHESEPGEYNFRGRGRRKWLEQAAKENGERYIKYLADEIKRNVK